MEFLGFGKPAGYNKKGVSLYYNSESFARSLTSARLMRTRKLHFGSINDLELEDIGTKNTVNGHDIKSPSYALKEYIRTTFGKRKIPVYVFDDHNHAFFAWMEAKKVGKITDGSVLYHFDDHSDGKKSAHLPVDNSLEQIANYAQSLDFDNFIDPAVRLGVISKVYWIQTTYENDTTSQFNGNEYAIPQEEIKHNPDKSDLKITQTFSPTQNIVDIDLDYFSHLEAESEAEKRAVAEVKKCMETAGVITFAISPGFSDEHRAIATAKRDVRLCS